MHAASVKMILGVVIPTWSPGGEDGDPQTGWIGGGSLRTAGCSFQVDNSNKSEINLYYVRCGRA